MITAGVALIASAALVVASGIVRATAGGLAFPGAWWSIPAVAAGSILVALIIASYVGTPIGADATLCDTRWPALGLIALFLATDTMTVAPVLTGITPPVVAVAAILLLVWALRERLASERRAMDGDGEVCLTCRPLIARASSEPRDIHGPDHASEEPLPRSPKGKTHP